MEFTDVPCANASPGHDLSDLSGNFKKAANECERM